jgi:hypothetical protein
MNNSYGVGLGFRCAKTAPAELDQQIRDAAVSAMVEMGRERFREAAQAVERGLAIDPKNVELLDLKESIGRSLERS